MEAGGLNIPFQTRLKIFCDVSMIEDGVGFNVIAYSGLTPFGFGACRATGGLDGLISWNVTVEFLSVCPSSWTVSRRMESIWKVVLSFVATSERNASRVARCCAS